MKLTSVLIPEAYLAAMDELVRTNQYASVSEVIRMAIRDLVDKEIWRKKKI